MPSKIFPICFFVLIAFSACQSRITKYGEEFSQLMMEDDGVFRGINIGDTKDQVMQTEVKSPSQSTESQLIYEGLIGENDEYTIKYGFENNRLFEILVEVSFSETADGQKMLNGFRAYFDEKYGPFNKEGGYLVWKTPDGPVNKDVTIEMTDESEFQDFKNWTLSIYHQAPVAGPVVNEPAL